MPTAPLILTALLGLTARELFHLVVPSAEKREITKTRDTVLDRIEVTSELGNDIQNLSVVLAFHEPLPVAVFKDESVLTFLRREKSPFPYIEAFGQVSHIGTGPNEAPISIYFTGKSSPDGRHVVGPTQGYPCVSREGTLSELPIPFSLSHAAQTPFRFVKDLEDCHVQVFLSPKLAKAAKRLDVVANTGWGMNQRLRLLSKDLQPSDWTETDYDIRLRFWRKGPEEKRRIASLKESLVKADWRITPREAVREAHPKPFLEGFRVPYRLQVPEDPIDSSIKWLPPPMAEGQREAWMELGDWPGNPGRMRFDVAKLKAGERQHFRDKADYNEVFPVVTNNRFLINATFYYGEMPIVFSNSYPVQLPRLFDVRTNANESIEVIDPDREIVCQVIYGSQSGNWVSLHGVMRAEHEIGKSTFRAFGPGNGNNFGSEGPIGSAELKKLNLKSILAR